MKTLMHVLGAVVAMFVCSIGNIRSGSSKVSEYAMPRDTILVRFELYPQGDTLRVFTNRSLVYNEQLVALVGLIDGVKFFAVSDRNLVIVKESCFAWNSIQLMISLNLKWHLRAENTKYIQTYVDNHPHGQRTLPRNTC